MSIESLFDHKCDIYHLKKEERSPGFGLPSSVTFSYAEIADKMNIPCHFCIKYRDSYIKQEEPQNIYDGRIKLVLPTGTDIRMNDKVVDRTNDMEYTAQIPKNIRGHHIVVFVKRVSVQEDL